MALCNVRSHANDNAHHGVFNYKSNHAKIKRAVQKIISNKYLNDNEIMHMILLYHRCHELHSFSKFIDTIFCIIKQLYHHESSHPPNITTYIKILEHINFDLYFPSPYEYLCALWKNDEISEELSKNLIFSFIDNPNVEMPTLVLDEIDKYLGQKSTREIFYPILHKQKRKSTLNVNISKLNKQISSGCFSTVYKYKKHAVKCYNVTEFNYLELREMAILSLAFRKDYKNVIHSKRIFYENDEENEDSPKLYILFDLFDYDLSEHKINNDDDIKKIIRDVANGIKELHDADIIHRDIKPGNILVKDDQFYVCDFNLSRTFNSKQMTPGRYFGTDKYKAPEINDDVSTIYTKKIDIWSLGVTILSVLGYPMHSSELKYIKTIIKNIDSTLSDHDSDLVDLIKHMLKINPKDRFDIDQVLSHKFLVS
jgi:thiamine kinase-like enzyme